MSYSDVKQLPIRYRHWYLNRLVRHFEEKNNLFSKKNTNNDIENIDDKIDIINNYQNFINNNSSKGK